MGHQSEFVNNPKISESSDWKSPNIHSIDFENVLSMDEVVRLSLINDNWKIVESKRSRMISTLPQNAVKSLTPPLDSHRISQELSTLWTNRIEQQKLNGINGLPTRVSFDASELSRDRINADEEFDGVIRKHNSVEQNVSPVKNQSWNSDLTKVTAGRYISSDYNVDFDDFDGNTDIAEAMLNITSKKKKQIPLPDFDDFNSDDEEFGREDGFHFSDPWDMKEQRLYENLVGVDLKRPLFMYVPQSHGDNTPRIGELEADKLSELSENDSKTDETVELRSDLEDEHFLPKKPNLLRTDSWMQTDNSSSILLTKDMGTMTAADIIAEIKAERSKLAINGLSGKPLIFSSEFDEIDPRFVQSPESCVELLEGETISVDCRVIGTEPIDVFWFRDVEEVNQLEENERCDIGRSSDRFTLDLFSATMKDAGHYLCIGVNTKGHCVRAFQIKILENKKPKSPAGFSLLPQNIEVLEKSEAKLSCKVSGYPPPRVLWYCGNDRLRNGEQYKIESFADGEHRLTIRNVGDTSTGYSVTVQNFLNEVETTVQVRVIKELKEKGKPTLPNLAKSPYPDVEELVEIAQKVSPSAKGATTPNLTSRFSFRSDNLLDEKLLKNKLTPQKATRSISLEQTQDLRPSHDSLILLTSRKNAHKNGESLSDEEQELDISYQDFERLFDAKLITRLQLHSGRVRKKDFQKIRDFLREDGKNTTTDVRFSKSGAVNTGPLHIDCGLKKVNSDFYSRDYVVNDSSKRSGRHNSGRLNHPMHKWTRSNSLQLPIRETSVLDGSRVNEPKAAPEEFEKVTDGQLEDVTLPCVKEILSKFSNNALSPDMSQDDVSPLKRIYSLTGRSVPEFVRDRIQRRTSERLNKEFNSLMQNNDISIVQSPNDVNNNNNNVISQSIDCDLKVNPKNHLIRRSISLNLNEGKDGKQLTNGKQIVGHKPVLDKSKLAKQTIKMEHQNSIRNDIVKPQKKPVDSVVMQRAAYWDKRISQQQPSEPFPEMMVDSNTGVEM